MERANLLLLIQNFLSKHPIRHSSAWQNEMLERIIKLNLDPERRYLFSIYGKMTEELINNTKSYVKKKYPQLNFDIIEEITYSAYDILCNTFDGERGLELPWIKSTCLNEAYKQFFETSRRKIGREEVWDENISDIRTEDRWVIVYPTNFQYEKKEFEDESNGDSISPEIDSGSNHDDLICEKEKFVFTESIENALSNQNLESEEFDKAKSTDRQKHLNNAAERSEDAAKLLYRYYLIKGVAHYRGNNNLPSIKERLDIDVILKEIKEQNAFLKEADNHLFIKRYNILRKSTERYYMELCVNLMKEGVEKFNEEIKQGYFKQSQKGQIPMVSAIAIDEHGKIIESCYKGQIVSFSPQRERRTFQKHCEYTLLEEIITSREDKERLKGGTLFVTLEPCNKRIFFCQNPNCNKDCRHEIAEPIIPCAVRCLESGISKIYIGMYDTNEEVTMQGHEILKSGCYTFELKDGSHFSRGRYPQKDIHSQMLLEKYFQEKGYELIYDDKSKRVYRICDKLNVRFFDNDLIEEICDINATFLNSNNKRRKNKEDFYI